MPTRPPCRTAMVMPILVSLVALLGAAALAQTPAAPPAPPLASPAPDDASATLAERIAALLREEQALIGEIESLRSRSRTADGGGDADASRLPQLERRLEEVEAELSRLRLEERRQPPPAITGSRGPLDPAGLGTFQVTGDPGATGQVTAGRSFNPSISVIPDGVYFADDRDGASGEIASEADGFHAHGGEGEEGHAHGGAVPRGFSLREAEVAFSGSVDPYFDVWAIFAVADGELEVEETYVQTRKLLPGLQLRFGKFFSGIGYINRQHPHQWDFVDQALPYALLFGGTLDEVGVQLSWLPDLPVYTQLAIEALQGDNERVSAQVGAGDETPFFRDVAGPRLLTGVLKVSPDLGYSSAFQIGVFAGRSRNHQELHDEDGDGGVDEAFEGTSTFFGTDWVYRYDSGKSYGKGDLTLQAEYVHRVKDLDLVAESREAVTGGPAVRFAQDGLYAQAVYGFAPRWTVGLRFDVAGLTNRVEEGDEATGDDSSRRVSANLTFNPTEFSRLRVQWSRGDFSVGGSRETFNQLHVQFQMSLGAHGAHSF